MKPPRFDTEAIRAALPIDVAAGMLGSRLRGGRGPCPLCGTGPRSTAFSVREPWWKCFACGENGDVIALIAKAEGIQTWREAIKRTAEIAGVDPIHGKPPKKIAPRVDPERERDATVGRVFRELAAIRDRCRAIGADGRHPIAIRADALAAVVHANRAMDIVIGGDRAAIDAMLAGYEAAR